MKNLLSVFSLFAAVVLVFSGCAKMAPKCVSPEDTPAHHYVTGMELIEAGRINEAGEKFERARYCDSGYGPAYAGLAIVSAEKAAAATKEGYRKVDVEAAWDMLETSGDKAATVADDFAFRLASMRVYTAIKPSRKWLNNVEDDYKKAMKLKVDEKKLLFYEGREAASFFMGKAYLEGREFQDAGFGVGPIDATFNTIANMVESQSRLLRFSVNAITGGMDAQGEVTVRLQENGRVAVGKGADPDIITASAKAFVNGLNRLAYLKRNPSISPQERTP
jgi:hypothetical protein